MDDLVIASTTDTEEQIKAALEPREDKTPTLSETDRTTGATTPPGETKPSETAEATPAETSETAEVTETPTAETATPAEAKPPRKKSRSEERINELTREKYLAQRRAERLEQELAQYKEQIQQHQQQPPKPSPPPVQAQEPTESRKPDVKDYAVYEDFIDALTRYNAQQITNDAIAGLREQDAQNVAVYQQQQVLNQFESAKTQARERYDDFDTVMTSDVSLNMPLNDQMQRVITTSPVGHDIAYFLVKHPDVAQAIYQQPAEDAWRTLGRLEERIALTVTPPAPQSASGPGNGRPPMQARVTTATAPITPVGGQSTQTSVPDDQLSYRDYKAKRDREEWQRRQHRRR